MISFAVSERVPCEIWEVSDEIFVLVEFEIIEGSSFVPCDATNFFIDDLTLLSLHSIVDNHDAAVAVAAANFIPFRHGRGNSHGNLLFALQFLYGNLCRRGTLLAGLEDSQQDAWLMVYVRKTDVEGRAAIQWIGYKRKYIFNAAFQVVACTLNLQTVLWYDSF